jgi:hypothetical protein
MKWLGKGGDVKKRAERLAAASNSDVAGNKITAASTIFW